MYRTRNIARSLAAFAVLALAAGITLAAQKPESTTLESKQVPDFSGFWQTPGGAYIPGHGFVAKEACAAIKDPGGEPMPRCPHPSEPTGGAQFGPQ